jgi:hypothetical protein
LGLAGAFCVAAFWPFCLALLFPVCKAFPVCLLVWILDLVLYLLPAIYFLCIVVPINNILAVQKKKMHVKIYFHQNC